MFPSAVSHIAPRYNVAMPTSATNRDARRAKVEDLLSQLTLQEKIMQMGQVDKVFMTKAEHLSEFGVGSLISGGSGQPFENTPCGFADMVDSYQQQALKSRLGIPLLYGGDAVHGQSLGKGTTIFPHNIGLGAAGDEHLVEAIGRATAIEACSGGLYWVFSPCVAVVDDIRWGRTYESFGSDPELVGRMGAALIRGLHGDGLGTPGSVAACAKHFAGDGGVRYGTGPMNGKLDRGDVRINDEEFRRVHIHPYMHAVKAGCRTVMVSFSSVDGRQLHAHSDLIDGCLRGELGFDGVVVSDWGGHSQLREGENHKEKLALTVNAGIDIVMIPEDYLGFLKDMREAVEEGLIPLSRIDDAVRRILDFKAELGLFEKPSADRSLLPRCRCGEHVELARRAVQKSLVLLKNDRGLLPLKPQSWKAVHVSGKSADDLGLACGGWTASWQGQRGDITEGTTIYQALKEALPDVDVVLSVEGEGLKPGVHDLAICCVGEEPFAEWFGDRDDLSLPEEDARTLERVSGKGVPLVVVQVNSRPLLHDYSQVDALLMAWLPGSEGGGVVDGLLGASDITGRMPIGLPAAMTVDTELRELFMMGAGLTARKH